MKKTISAILIILIIMTGLFLFLYPTVSNIISERESSRTIDRYSESVGGLGGAERIDELQKAREYNRALYAESIGEEYMVSASDYNSVLNIGGDGMMAYIEIPAISCRLPVYHGTEASTLESYVGHLPSSSLPVGGESTHCVLTGHTGLPSARLLTDLDKLKEGDRFTLTTLDSRLTYEVDRVLVVEPDETEALKTEEGLDLCTLVTCTPYGVNTHRLLVRGRRVADSDEEITAGNGSLAEILINNPVMLALAALLIILMAALAFMRLQRK